MKCLQPTAWIAIDLDVIYLKIITFQDYHRIIDIWGAGESHLPHDIHTGWISYLFIWISAFPISHHFLLFVPKRICFFSHYIAFIMFQIANSARLHSHEAFLHPAPMRSSSSANVKTRYLIPSSTIVIDHKLLGPTHWSLLQLS